MKYKNGVVIGADRRLSDSYTNCDDVVKKVIKTKHSNHCIGIVGNLKDINLISANNEFISYEDIVKKVEVNIDLLTSKLIPKMHTLMKNNNNIVIEKGMEYMRSWYTYCINEKIFAIQQDGSVFELDTYHRVVEKIWFMDI